MMSRLQLCLLRHGITGFLFMTHLSKYAYAMLCFQGMGFDSETGFQTGQVLGVNWASYWGHYKRPCPGVNNPPAGLPPHWL